MKTTAKLSSNGPCSREFKLKRLIGVFCTALAAVGVLGLAGTASAINVKARHGFNQPGNLLIADQFNNRVIEISPAGDILWSFGLGPNDFSASSIIGVNDVQRVGPLTLMAGTGTPAGLIPQAPNGAADNRVMIGYPRR